MAVSIPLVVGAGFQMYGGYKSSKNSAEAMRAQNAYQKEILGINLEMAAFKAEEAVKRGDKNAQVIRKEGQKIIGSQRAIMAAQGVVLDSGSALDIQADTAAAAEVDALQTKNNAIREAFGYKTQAISAGMEGKMADFAAQNNINNTLLTGGLNAANAGLNAYSQYQSMKGKK